MTAHTQPRPVAVVTGVSSGIGAAIAQRLLDDGWAVSGVSRRRPVLGHPGLSWVEADLTAQGAVETVAAAVPDPTAVVHAAGILRSGYLGELEAEAFEAMWRLHVEVPTRLVDALSSRLATGGRIVLIGSRTSTGVRRQESIRRDESRARRSQPLLGDRARAASDHGERGRARRDPDPDAGRPSPRGHPAAAAAARPIHRTGGDRRPRRLPARPERPVHHRPATCGLRGSVTVSRSGEVSALQVLGLVADDLTGAADSAAGFAERGWEVTLHLATRRPHRRRGCGADRAGRDHRVESHARRTRRLRPPPPRSTRSPPPAPSGSSSRSTPPSAARWPGSSPVH